jgi:hypothetical protein
LFNIGYTYDADCKDTPWNEKFLELAAICKQPLKPHDNEALGLHHMSEGIISHIGDYINPSDLITL